MAVSSLPQREVKKWRKIVFGVVAAVLALLLLAVGVFVLLSPWNILVGSATATYHPQIHRWHDAVAGALLTILWGGALLSLVWQGQRKPVLAQFFVLGILIFSLTTLAFDPASPTGYLIPTIIIALFLLAYPAPRELLNFKRTGLSIPLLALSVAALALLAPNIWQNVQLQLMDKFSEHAQNSHWISTALLEVLLPLAGFLSAFKRPGSRILSSITGIALVYLGAAAQAVPNHPGSWGMIGGALALLGGLGNLVTTMLEKQAQSIVRERPTVPKQPAGVVV